MSRTSHTAATRHYPALDGLRGLAVLFVMLHHFVRSYDSASDFHAFALRLTEFMWTGVDLFFVLSGFLITRILLETLGDAHYFRTFYLRRVLRIFPLYYGLLAVAFLIMPLIGLGPSSESRVQLPYLFTFTSNIHFAFSGWSMHAFDVYWSLAVEEQFYLFWPVTLLVVPARYHKALVLTGLVACVIARYVAVHAGVSSTFLFTMLPTHADGLLIGALIALFVHAGKRLPRVSNLASVVLFVSASLFFLAGTFQLLGLRFYYDAWNTRGAMSYYSVIAMTYGSMLYVSIAGDNPIQRMFSNATLRRVGTYSYCLYLIHQAVAHLMNWAYGRYGVEAELHSKSPILADAAHLVPLFAVTLILAALSWKFIERPILRLKKRVPYGTGNGLRVASSG